MPDIKCFWESFKCSWAKRMMQPNSAWLKVLQANILYSGYDLDDIIYEGPDVIQNCALKQSNKFWKETLLIFAKLTTEISFYRPDYFFDLNLFDNNHFKYGNNTFKKYNFPILWSKNMRQIGDYFDCISSPPRLLELHELNEKYGSRVNFLQYHQIKTGLDHGAKKLNYKIFNPKLSDLQLPRLPLLFKIAVAQPKGCNFFYSILSSKQTGNRTSASGESKWHEKLGANLSVTFWDKILKLPKVLLVPNKLRWVQIQINKHLLPTNYTVNKYDRTVSPLCSFCSAHLEQLHLLFHGCGVVSQFWTMISNLIKNFYPNFNLGRKEALFGDEKTTGNSTINTILILARGFIWKQKFTSKELDEINFINFAQQHLLTIFLTHKLKGKENEFVDNWKDILEYFQVDI